MHPTPTDPPAPGCPSTGRHGTEQAYNHDRCRCPAARARATRARKQRATPDYPGAHVDATGTRRRIEALLAAGWRNTDIGGRLGVTKATLYNYREATHVLRRTAARVAAVYDGMQHRRGPSPIAAARAVKAGYVPPIGWDDDTIDDPAAGPWQGIDDEGRAVVSPPAPWDAGDVAAVGRIVARLRAAHPGRPDSTVRSEAYRVHYRRTGRVRSHGRQGWVSGCRCLVCESGERAPRVGGAAQQHAGAAS